jgi:hypothetical protein
MAIRWYVMPAEVVEVSAGSFVRRPEHLGSILGLSSKGSVLGTWGWLPVKDNWGIGWVDLTNAQHNTYNAAAGVLFLTADLNATLTAGQVTGVQTRLDARNLPSSWVDTTDTWAQVIKRIFGFIQCIQRYYGESKQSLNVGVAVTTAISSLSQTVQDRLDVVASTFPSGALPAVNHATDTVETMMMRWADELITRPVFVSGIEL